MTLMPKLYLEALMAVWQGQSLNTSETDLFVFPWWSYWWKSPPPSAGDAGLILNYDPADVPQCHRAPDLCVAVKESLCATAKTQRSQMVF